ncbi:MAG: hypothetical protein DRJ03_19985 [Chloroflexi bacterium]|nr:MAG: hypothetical protein DRI81_10395 [Chloroflexota bacterium]RLC81607.1 MAG: hypothetical protein DRJ03_19985 [Chloroflexota bacterium]
MIYVVLGMHKSGTTLVAEMLHHSGVNMGDAISVGVSYDRGNKYERETTLRLDMDILGAQEFSVLHLTMPPTLYLTEAQRTRMREIIQICNNRYTHWGFKDPRASLVYPLWAEELPEHKLIAIYRSPEEIWPRFRYNGARYFYTNPRRAWAFISRWCEHNANILSYLHHSTMDCLVLNYQALMTTQAEFDRLQAFVGFPVDDRRKPDLYRSRTQTYPTLQVVAWLIGKQTGWTPERIIEQFETLRRKE